MRLSHTFAGVLDSANALSARLAFSAILASLGCNRGSWDYMRNSAMTQRKLHKTRLACSFETGWLPLKTG